MRILKIVFVVMIIAMSSCSKKSILTKKISVPAQAKKSTAPGQVKKTTGSQSAAPYAPGQKKKTASAAPAPSKSSNKKK